MNTEVSQRYARAMFDLASKANSVEDVLNQLREVNAAVEKDSEIRSYFTGPTVQKADQENVLNALLEKRGFSEYVKGLLTVLVRKRRFGLLPGIVAAYQAAVDNSQSIARGVVRSASILLPDERRRLEQTISKYTGKKVVLEYHKDPELLGGLVAQVGSFTFDDSIETQLRLMRDALKKRRAI